jgi:hypothetical protein
MGVIGCTEQKVILTKQMHQRVKFEIELHCIFHFALFRVDMFCLVN